MKQIIASAEITHENPANIKTDEVDVLGKTLIFTEDERITHINYNNILALHISDNKNKNKYPVYERIVLNSNIIYDSVDLIDTNEYEHYNIENYFGDDQIVFISSSGIFITRKNSIISLTETLTTSGAVRSQPVPVPDPAPIPNNNLNDNTNPS